MPAEQTFIPGTEPPHHDADIERAIATWTEAKVAQKRAAAATKQAHATVVLHIQHAGLEAYPWTNPDTGRRRNIVITREPKAKEAAAPRMGRSSRRGGDVKTAEDKREERKRREEEKVEVRRVPRASVAKEIDPFGATRAAMAKRGKGKKKR